MLHALLQNRYKQKDWGNLYLLPFHQPFCGLSDDLRIILYPSNPLNSPKAVRRIHLHRNIRLYWPIFHIDSCLFVFDGLSKSVYWFQYRWLARLQSLHPINVDGLCFHQYFWVRHTLVPRYDHHNDPPLRYIPVNRHHINDTHQDLAASPIFQFSWYFSASDSQNLPLPLKCGQIQADFQPHFLCVQKFDNSSEHNLTDHFSL